MCRGTFAVFACACFGAYLWATHAVPETGGIALEDMDAVFSGDAGKADAELRREVRIILFRIGSPTLKMKPAQIEDELGLTALVRAAVGER